MKHYEKSVYYIEQDILMILVDEHEYNQEMMLSIITHIFDNQGIIIIVLHHVNVPTDILGIYHSADEFMRRYSGVFNKL